MLSGSFLCMQDVFNFLSLEFSVRFINTTQQQVAYLKNRTKTLPPPHFLLMEMKSYQMICMMRRFSSSQIHLSHVHGVLHIFQSTIFLFSQTLWCLVKVNLQTALWPSDWRASGRALWSGSESCAVSFKHVFKAASESEGRSYSTAVSLSSVIFDSLPQAVKMYRFLKNCSCEGGSVQALLLFCGKDSGQFW